jgi:hypothetical protein
MFFQNNDGLKNDTQKIAENITLAQISLKEFTKQMKSSITDVQSVINQAAAINSQTANQVRQTLGQSRVVSNQVQEVIAQATKSTGLLGIDASKNIELFGALNTAMQRNTYFTELQITRFQALGFSANLTSQQLAEMATSFDTLGYTTDETLIMMENMTEEAKSYGLNVSQFMDQVNKNLGLMVGYNFKGGVEGLSKMVAQAQALRIDMAATKGFAEDMLDPSKAIETAAGFQMLGGEIGALGDPFKLLHMAQTDMAGLQDELVKMSAASVSFNKETGEFDIPVTQMYRMREAAKLAGRSYEDFSQMAMNAAQRTQKLKILDGFTSVDEDKKELIASLGKIGANGNLEITMPDGSLRKISEGFNELTETDYKELAKMQKVDKMGELEVAKKSMGYLEEIKYAQDTITKLTTLNLVQSGDFNKIGENISKANSLLANKFLDREDEINIPESVTTASSQVFTQLKLTNEQADSIVNGTISTLNKVNKEIDNRLIPALERLTDGLELKGIMDELKNINIKSIFSGVTDVSLWPDTVNAYFDRSNTESGETSEQNNQIEAYQRDNTEVYDRTNGNLNVQSVQSANLNIQNANITNGNQTANQSILPMVMDSINKDAVNNITNGNNFNQSSQTPQNSQTPQFAVKGEVNLKIEGLPTNSNISKETVAELLVRNPQAMSIIESQLNNTSDWV